MPGIHQFRASDPTGMVTRELYMLSSEMDDQVSTLRIVKQHLSMSFIRFESVEQNVRCSLQKAKFLEKLES